MTRIEIKIIGPLLKRIRKSNLEVWNDLKYQTQFGPDFSEFPYYPAALELEPFVRKIIMRLPDKNKRSLIAEWHSKSRLISLNTEEEILQQYGTIFLDYIVETARWAGLRTDFDY